MHTQGLLPSFAGIPTFLRAPQGTARELKSGSVAVLGAPHDATSGAREGARYGPRAIRDASVDFGYDLEASASNTLVDIETGKQLHLPSAGVLLDLGDISVYPMSPGRSAAALRSAASRVVRRGAFPAVLGGDAFITYPLLQGVARGLGEGVTSMGYIQVSSQLNLGDAHVSLGKSWNGATARRIMESGLVKPSNMVFLGVTGYTATREWELARSADMTMITVKDLRESDVERTVQRAQEVAGRGCEAIYLSVDIGAVDTGQAAGRGDVVIGGMVPRELLELMRAFSDAGKVRAMDFVEVAPNVDPSGRAERLAAEAVIEFISTKALS